MKFELFPFQQKAQRELLRCVTVARRNYREDGDPQVISFTAPTGSGKTIMIASMIESIYNGDENHPAQVDAIFVWLSDSPELNKQSKDKFYFYADGVNDSQLVMIEDESFNRKILSDGKIYFLNTQKLGKSSNLTKNSDVRQYTIWETLQNTITEKADKLYFIIDEAHRGMKGTQAGRAATIMQKFIKGSPEDGLSPAPLVIGMSATIQRFNALVAGTTSTNIIVTVDEVKNSGLLKDRIIVVHPDEVEQNYISKDMAMLEAAADEWKNKCEHWAKYCREQKERQFNPVFVVQVMNSTGNRVSETNLNECLRIISNRTGYYFDVGEVVHTFGQAQDITVNNLRVLYREPSQISGDDKIRIVFFKESLSTGWDCPKAETMMSFRHAVDSTYIAQLLGRIIRTPLRRHIEVDETLNDVHLYLPYFDKETVKSIVEELHNSESGSIPTEILTSKNKFVTWTVETKNADDVNDIFSLPNDHADKFETPTINLSNDVEPVKPPKLTAVNNVSANDIAPIKSKLDRVAILKVINGMGLITQRISSTRINDYLRSLLKMAHFLTRHGIDRDAVVNIHMKIVNQIHNYIEELRHTGEYDNLNRRIRQFKISAQIFDPLDKSFNSIAEQNLFTTTDADLERQFNQAEVKLKSDGIAQYYVDKFLDANYDKVDDCMIDVILFTENNNCLDNLETSAKRLFHELKDKHRLKVAKLSSTDKSEYDKIVSEGDEVSDVIFELPKTARVPYENSGKEYDDHLFVDEKTGTAHIKLNDWEERILHEEQQREDFVCWLRNPQNKGSTWAMCIAYKDESHETHSFFPDLLIIRRSTDGYVADILEPHNPCFRDNVGKAQGLADYAQKTIGSHIGIGRLQLIREVKTDGRSYFKRLDISKSEIRNEIRRITSNAELDRVFERYAESAINTKEA